MWGAQMKKTQNRSQVRLARSAHLRRLLCGAAVQRYGWIDRYITIYIQMFKYMHTYRQKK